MYQGDINKILLFVAGRSQTKRIQAEKERLKVNQLFSWINEKKEVLETVEKLRTDPDYNIKLFIDCGAYSAFTKGKVVDIDEYCDFINSIGDAIFCFAALDVIGTGSFQTEREASNKTWNNFLYMVEKIKPEYWCKMMPVFHANEDFSCLQRMLDYVYPDGKHIAYIGLGALTEATARQRKEWFDVCYKLIRKSNNPDVMTHGFGCTQLDVLSQEPITSADSSSWIQQSIYGSILVNGSAVFFSDQQYKQPAHFHNLPPQRQEEIRQHLAKFDLTPEDMKTTEMRQIYHLRMYKDWEDHYQYRGSTMSKNILF